MTIGIGTDADRKLVQRIAEVMNGISRMLVDELDLTAALAVIIDYIHTQYYVNVHVDQCEVVQCSKVLYPAHPLDMFLRLTPKQLIEDPVYQCNQSWCIPVVEYEQSSNLIEKLYVNAVICQLEEQLCPDVERIVALSVKYGLMNEHTSFLIVSDNKVDMSSASLVNVQVPHYGHHPPVDTPLEKKKDGLPIYSGEMTGVKANLKRSREVIASPEDAEEEPEMISIGSVLDRREGVLHQLKYVVGNNVRGQQQCQRNLQQFELIPEVVPDSLKRHQQAQDHARKGRT
eukprot:gene34156-42116_t